MLREKQITLKTALFFLEREKGTEDAQQSSALQFTFREGHGSEKAKEFLMKGTPTGAPDACIDDLQGNLGKWYITVGKGGEKGKIANIKNILIVIKYTIR